MLHLPHVPIPLPYFTIPLNTLRCYAEPEPNWNHLCHPAIIYLLVVVAPLRPYSQSASLFYILVLSLCLTLWSALVILRMTFHLCTYILGIN